jgi:hypothetical protein
MILIGILIAFFITHTTRRDKESYYKKLLNIFSKNLIFGMHFLKKQQFFKNTSKGF